MIKNLKIMNKYIILIITNLCLIFNSCSNEKKYKEYSINDLSKPITDTLKGDNKNRVIGVEVVISGEINGEATLEFENGSGRVSKIDLKGKINQTYETEWYSPDLTFRYTPIMEAIQGDSIKLKYRMY